MNQFRQLYSKVINDKHDDVMAKFGAILAQGILDAGLCSTEVHNYVTHYMFILLVRNLVCYLERHQPGIYPSEHQTGMWSCLPPGDTLRPTFLITLLNK